ncbi:hypothetical protein MHYP_G00201760 [Metynnis hypsauchen]
MLSHGFLFAVIHLSAYVHCNVRVEQHPAAVHQTIGENTTIFCKICADGGENISRCDIEWYRRIEDSLPEVKQLSQFRGRFHEFMDGSQLSGNLSLTTLELNDTGKYYCNYICWIDGRMSQHNGYGTNLSVHEEATVTTATVITTNTVNTDAFTEKTTDDTLYTFLLFLPLSLKLLRLHGVGQRFDHKGAFSTFALTGVTLNPDESGLWSYDGRGVKFSTVNFLGPSFCREPRELTGVIEALRLLNPNSAGEELVHRAAHAESLTAV